MTPRYPYRRRWRETIVPVLWLLGVSVLLGVALGLSIVQGGGAS